MMKFIFNLVQDFLNLIVKTVWDFGEWIFKSVTAFIFGEGGLLIWWIDAIVDTFFWLLEKLPAVGFPPVALHAWNFVSGYLVLFNLVLPIFELFLILQILLLLWATVTVLNYIRRSIPFLGSLGR